jgi:dihydrofolate reductase
MGFSIIAAMDPNRGIGKDNAMPWHCKADMKHFAQTTKGHTVIMGRKTWESLPEKYRPLPDRLNVVVSRQKDYPLPEGVELVHSLDEALQFEGELFVMGGATLYSEAIVHPDCDHLIITMISPSFDCDAFFPEIPADYTQSDALPFQKEGDLEYAFLLYKRII